MVVKRATHLMVMSDCSVSKKTLVRYAFFDFDQTISRCHVFKQLAGWEAENQCVPPPFACTERGQINRISELNCSKCWLYNEDKHALTAVASESAADAEFWTCAALGGAARVARLRTFFADLRDKGVIIIVITKGFVGAVRKILAEEHLLEHVAEVYGHIGGDMYGKTEYDEALQVACPLEGSKKYSLSTWAAKVNIIRAFMRKNGLRPAEAVLVEDDPLEIEAVQGTCRSVFVSGQRGVMQAEMDEIRKLAGAHAGQVPLLSVSASASTSTSSCVTKNGKRTFQTSFAKVSKSLVVRTSLKKHKNSVSDQKAR